MPEGGCLCGAVRYRVTDEAVARTLCHCASCRRATGGASVGWAVFEKGDFALLQGEVREYSSSPGILLGLMSHLRKPRYLPPRFASRPP